MRTLEQGLSRIDLNLLVSLSVLIKERNVSRAAEVLYLSQPTMSRMLGNIRELLDDPLFYRKSNGLQPTSKTLELEDQLDSILYSIKGLLDGFNFSPESCEKTFRISMPPLMSKALTVPLSKAIYELAPNVTLEEYSSAADPILLLKDNDVDFSIHIKDAVVINGDYRSEVIGSTYPVIYGAIDHPLLQKENITIDDCLVYSFVDLSLDIRSGEENINPFDIKLAKQGKHRTVVLKSGQLSTLIASIEGTELLFVSNHILEEDATFNSYCKVIKRLEPEAYAVNIYIIEHRRTFTSPSHLWLRSVILGTIKDNILIS